MGRKLPQGSDLSCGVEVGQGREKGGRGGGGPVYKALAVLAEMADRLFDSNTPKAH